MAQLHLEPWPAALVARALALVALPGEFECDPSPTARAEIARKLAGADAGADRLSLPAALSILRHSQRERRAERAAFLDRRPKEVARAAARYRAGEPIMALARELDAPPLALFKRLMLALKTHVPVWELGARDRAQWAEARAHDCTGMPRRELLHEEALRFEDRVAAALSAAGLEFAREPAQRAAGSRNTPDFLLPRAATLAAGARAARFRFADAKAYFGGPGAAEEIRAQLERYVRAYGPGLVVFRFGYDAALARRLRRSPVLKNKIALAWME